MIAKKYYLSWCKPFSEQCRAAYSKPSFICLWAVYYCIGFALADTNKTTESQHMFSPLYELYS